MGKCSSKWDHFPEVDNMQKRCVCALCLTESYLIMSSVWVYRSKLALMILHVIRFVCAYKWFYSTFENIVLNQHPDMVVFYVWSLFDKNANQVWKHWKSTDFFFSHFSCLKFCHGIYRCADEHFFISLFCYLLFKAKKLFCCLVRKQQQHSTFEWWYCFWGPCGIVCNVQIPFAFISRCEICTPAN